MSAGVIILSCFVHDAHFRCASLISIFLLALQFCVNQTLAIFFGIVSLACYIAQILLGNNLVIILFDFGCSQIVGMLWHYFDFYGSNLRHRFEPRVVANLVNWNSVLWIDFQKLGDQVFCNTRETFWPFDFQSKDIAKKVVL